MSDIENGGRELLIKAMIRGEIERSLKKLEKREDLKIFHYVANTVDDALKDKFIDFLEDAVLESIERIRMYDQ